MTSTPFRPSRPTGLRAASGLAVVALAAALGVTAIDSPAATDSTAASSAAVATDGVRLVQDATGDAQEMTVGEPVTVDLKPVVSGAAGGALPADAKLQVTGLPDGLAQKGWTITGTPTKPGTYDVLVTIDAYGQTASRSVQIAVEPADGADPSTSPAPAAATTATTPPRATTTPAPGAASGKSTATTGTAVPTTSGKAASSGTTASGTTASGTAASGTPASGTAASGTAKATTSPSVKTSAKTSGSPSAAAGSCGPLGMVDPASVAKAATGGKADQSMVAGIVGALAAFLPQLLGESAGSLAGCASTPGATPTSGAATSGTSVPTGKTTGAGADTGSANGPLALLAPILGLAAK